MEQAINRYLTTKDLSSTPQMEQIASQLSSTQSVLRACLGWVVDLGISSNMPFYQKKILALINATAFASLLLALPATFVLLLMGFAHPFSLLTSIVLAACLVLGLNGARRVTWSQGLFSFAPGAIILVYTLLELPSKGMQQPLNYMLARQGLCFALLIPVLIYGFEGNQKKGVISAFCLLILLVYDVGSMRQGAFEGEVISGLRHGLFTLLSLIQYAALAGFICFVQNTIMQHARQVQSAGEKLKSLAIRDGLTGLFNHGFMLQLIADAINRTRRSGNPLALVMIDVDFFKQINDTLGHNAGDDVLVRLARLLINSKRSTDYLGRWGGDELVLLLTDTNLAGAETLAEKLRSLVARQVFAPGRNLTISLGASQYQAGDTPISFIERADAAMYRAKRSGRNRVETAEKKQLAISN